MLPKLTLISAVKRENNFSNALKSYFDFKSETKKHFGKSRVISGKKIERTRYFK